MFIVITQEHNTLFFLLRAFAAYPLFPEEPAHWISAGVCDGLGLYGDLISDFASKEIIKCLRRHPLKTIKPITALKDSFLETDEIMRTNPEIKRSSVSSGSTACIAMLSGSHLWVANCGDSGAVIATKRHKKTSSSQSDIIARKLTREHTPTDLTERSRCIKKGAYISQPTEPGLADARYEHLISPHIFMLKVDILSHHRLWRNPEMTEVGLTLSRSLGHHGAQSVGVSAEAEVKEVHLQQNDLFVILGTDGLWQYIEPQEAVEYVYNEMKTGRSASHHESGAARAASKLIRLAIDRWREEQDDFRDDISAVIIGFLPAGGS